MGRRPYIRFCDTDIGRADARTETGEIQLTDYGISGIPVFQLSRFAVRALDEGCSVLVRLDFLPGYERRICTLIWNGAGAMPL